MKKALIVVDVQNDFCTGGSLAVKNGEQVIPIINKLLPEFDLVIFTKDLHEQDMDAFASSHDNKSDFDSYVNKQGETDKLWPEHCIAGTPGADLHKDIDFGAIKGEFYIFKKGTKKDFHPYSGFGAEELEGFLDDKGIEELYITGLATDYCVKDTAIDASFKGFDTTVIIDATRSIEPNIDSTMEAFQQADVKIIEAWMLSITKNV